MAMQLNLKVTKQDKRLFVGGIFLILFAVVFVLTLPALVSKSAIEADLKGAFKKTTGLDLEIQDGMDISFFPTPHVVLHNIFVSNVQGAVTSFMVSIHSMDAKLKPTSLFGSHPQIESVVLEGMSVELERLKNGHFNWKALQVANDSKSNEVSALSELSGSIDEAEAILVGLSGIKHVEIKDTSIRFTDSMLNLENHYNDIELTLDNTSESSKLALNMRTDTLPVAVNVDMGDLASAIRKRQTKAKVSVDSTQTHFEYEGDVDYREKLVLQGKTSIDSKNIANWINMMSGAKQADAGLKALPLTLSGDVTSEGGKILIPHLNVGGNIITGELNLGLKLPANVDVKGTLATLDFDALLDSGIFTPSRDKKDKTYSDKPKEDAESAPMKLPQKTAWSYVDLTTDIKIKDVAFNRHHLTDMLMQFDMSEGEMTITQLAAAFPGTSKVLFSGVGKEGYQGFMLDGQLDLYGESLIDMASTFKAADSTQDLLPPDFKKYRIKTNLVLSSQELRFTELVARVESMAFAGGIITSLGGEKVKIQSAMRLAGLNIDRLVTFFGLKKFKDAMLVENIGEAKVESGLVDWLKSVNYDLDARFSLEQYTLAEKQQDKSKVKIQISKNFITLSDMSVNIGDTMIEGSVGLDVSKLLPHFDFDLNLDALDLTSYMDGTNMILEPESGEKPADAKSQLVGRKWSHKGIDLLMFDRITSSFHMRVGQFKFQDLETIGLELRGGISERMLGLSSITAQIKGSQLSGKGMIKGGKIPSVNFTGELTNQEIADLQGLFPTLNGISGKFNTRFRLNTSGIDFHTWMYNLEGNMALSSKEVVVEGINIPGIVSAVAYVRTVADILDAVKRAYPGGKTIFNSVDGEWTLGNGKVRFPSIKLKSEFSDGDYSGEIDIINWKITSALGLSLTYLDKADPPRMSVHYTGSIEGMERELDTRYLERYVANKTSQQLLESPDQN